MSCELNRVAITGANGFVGSHVVRTLREAGIFPIPLVRTSQSEPYEIIVGNIDELHMHDLPSMDAMVHCVARTHVTRENKGSAFSAYRQINVEGTRSALKAAKRANAQHFVFLSSIKALGEETKRDNPFQDNSVAAPEDPYGITKLEAENVVREMASEWGMAWTIIRPPLVYGPGVVANFRSLIEFVERGVPLPFGSVTNKRSLIYVENLANFIHFCLRETSTRGKIFGISDEEALSTAEIIRKIAKASGKQARLINVPPFAAQSLAKWFGLSGLYRRLFASLEIDPSGAKNLGWRPPFDHDEAFNRTIKLKRSSLSQRTRNPDTQANRL